MKRARQDDDKDGGLDGAMERPELHPLVRGSCFEAMMDLCGTDQDWKRQVPDTDPFLQAWRVCIEPLLTYPDEQRLLGTLAMIEAEEEQKKQEMVMANRVPQPDQRPNSLLNRVSSPLLTKLMLCYRAKRYGIGMLLQAISFRYSDVLEYLAQCRFPIMQFVDRLITVPSCVDLVRSLLREPFYLSPHSLGNASHDMAFMLMTHPNVTVYWGSEEGSLRVAIDQFIVRDDVDLIEMAIAKGCNEFRSGSAFPFFIMTAARFKALKTLKRLLPGCSHPRVYLHTLEDIMHHDDWPLGVRAVFDLMPKPIDNETRAAILHATGLWSGFPPFRELSAITLIPLLQPCNVAPRDLAAACYRKKSPAFYRVLAEHKWITDHDEAARVWVCRPGSALPDHWPALFHELGADMHGLCTRYFSGFPDLFSFAAIAPYYHGPITVACKALFALILPRVDTTDAYMPWFLERDTDHLVGKWLLQNSFFGCDPFRQFEVFDQYQDKISLAVAMDSIDETFEPSVLCNFRAYVHQRHDASTIAGHQEYLTGVFTRLSPRKLHLARRRAAGWQELLNWLPCLLFPTRLTRATAAAIVKK